MFAVETENISKIYKGAFGNKQIHALSDMSLSVEQGSFFGLLGPNGAGKTTIIKILLGITNPSGGSAKVLGQDISNYKLKKKVGFLPENHRFPPYLTGEQVLKFFGGFSDMSQPELKKRIDYLLDLTKMNDRRKYKVKTYSKGMMQRIGLAQAMVNDPDLIFLDEPTDGVDPIGRKEIRDMLLNLKDQGKTIFLNSHLLSEVELVADRVAIIDKGKIIKEGTVKELTETEKEYKITFAGHISDSFCNSELTSQRIDNIHTDYFTLKAEDDDRLNAVIDAMRSEGLLIQGIVPIKTSLEDSFIRLINTKNGGVSQ
ncbi:MAG: ABC transporter ATP-binding protein [Candidatus Kapabacteria bacterium]|jgi:ABC-2 type transport system ATP-binding protein|nr:ABC transporter ATP-binding protein [Candidatus Kapabacteria bacterium]